MDFDLFTRITLNKNGLPLYRQLAEQLKDNILQGFLAPGDKLPSLNTFSGSLGINRLTAMRALDELEIEGWVMKQEKSGAFVAECLPEYKADSLGAYLNVSGRKLPVPDPTVYTSTVNYSRLSFNDGYPDHRLFPVNDVARAYSTTLKDHFGKEAYSYYDVYGHNMLRSSISTYSHKSRGIRSSFENVMITRGSTMGIFLGARTVCAPGETVAIGCPGYYLARQCFLNLGCQVMDVPVDEEGLDVVALARILKTTRIKLVYLTPHHHYPTTVTMPAERRVELLRLAGKYGFYILEDDYDFNFQFDRSPILPIASIDQLHSVIYVGGFSKSLSPALRIGFMLASEEIIRKAGKWRKLIDRQGDTLHELAFDKLLQTGIVESTIRKARKAYEGRHLLASERIGSELSSLFELSPSQGGLAFWSRVRMSRKEYGLFRQKAWSRDVYLMDPARFETKDGLYTRLGFASMNTEEIGEAVTRLAECL